jgi:hypothetical protein
MLLFPPGSLRGEEVQPWQTLIIDHYRGIDDDRCLL